MEMRKFKDLFKSKKRIEAERLAHEQEMKNREFNAKVTINKTLNKMKSQTKKLDEIKNGYIEQARKACLVNDVQSGKLARQGLKSCITKQRFLDSMIATFEISLQTNEMNRLIGDFVESMNLVSQEMSTMTSNFDISKAQSKYKEALQNNFNQNVALEEFIKEASDSIDCYEGDDDQVLDEEIDELISAQAVNSDVNIDAEISKKINAIKEKMNTH